MSDSTVNYIFSAYSVSCILVFIGLAIWSRYTKSNDKPHLFQNTVISVLWGVILPIIITLSALEFISDMYDKFTRRT
ncbi:hypothetical protein Xsze_02697 [Xenorhabdus szentirmaii DSM 16338]|nr:hypothetical protein Xsze_02697 [Xenorhabdus szentirmaii DSM 16338]